MIRGRRSIRSATAFSHNNASAGAWCLRRSCPPDSDRSRSGQQRQRRGMVPATTWDTRRTLTAQQCQRRGMVPATRGRRGPTRHSRRGRGGRMQVTKCACATIEAAYTAHWLPTVRALTRHGLSCDDAQDVVTDAFVLLLERHARHNPPRLMCPWIHYTARALKATLALRHRYAALGLQHRYLSEVRS